MSGVQGYSRRDNGRVHAQFDFQGLLHLRQQLSAQAHRRGERWCVTRARTCLRRLRPLPRCLVRSSSQLGPRACSSLQGLAHDTLSTRVIFLGLYRPESCSKDDVISRVVERYHLRRLLDCENLRVIHWQGECKDCYYKRFAHTRVLQYLTDWTEAEFATRNHHVKCIVHE
jgi:hypothetical protein